VDDTVEYEFIHSYIRRKRFEAKLIAVSVGEMLFGKRGNKQASLGQLRAMGFGIVDSGNTNGSEIS